MKRVIMNRFLAVLLVAASLLAMPLTGLAAAGGGDDSGVFGLSVNFADGRTALPGAQFHIYYVATKPDEGSDEFTLTGGFASCGAKLTNNMSASDMLEQIEKLLTVVNGGGVSPKASQSTDASGSALFQNLAEGVWLVTGDELFTEDYRYTPQAFCVYVPNYDAEHHPMAVTPASPKFERVPLQTLSVSKTVTGGAGDKTALWSFEISIEGKDVDANGTFPGELWDASGKVADTVEQGGVTFTDGKADIKFTGGKATVQLKHGQTLRLKLPVDTTYTVTETDANTDGYTTTNTGNTNGILTEGTNATVGFTNHKPSAASFTPGVDKTITGQEPPKEGTFTFTLTRQGDAPMPEDAHGDVATITTRKTGHADFGSITYTKAGVYTYKIVELNGGAGGYTYDVSEWTLTVTVTDNDGKLVATGQYTKTGETNEGEAPFTNKYEPASTTYKPSVSKTITGMTPPTEGEFTFTLTGDGDAPMPGGSNPTTAMIKTKDNGTGEFGDITYTKAGTYTYTIKETKGTAAGYTYDDSEWTLTVTVTDNDGKLEASANYEKDGVSTSDTAAFSNEYEASSTTFQPQVTKTVSGSPKENERFTFTLAGKDGAPMPTTEAGRTATVTTKDSATASFGQITYTAPGTYEYTVKETAGTTSGYTYDETEWTIKVEVKDEGGRLEATPTYSHGSDTAESIGFTNAYKTGDLTITKSVVGGNAYHGFQIQVDLTPQISGTFEVEDSLDPHKYTTVTFENGELKTNIYLQDATDSVAGLEQFPHSITIKGLPEGVTYTVSEVTEEDYTLSYGTEGYTGTISAGGPQKVDMTNTYTGGELKIKKSIEPGGWEDSTPFKVTVWVDGVTGPRGDYTFDSDHTVTFDIKAGEEVTIPGLPKDARYRVEEDVTDAGRRGYLVSYKDCDGTIPSGGTAEATITNTHEPGQLVITKTVDGGPDKLNTSKDYSFTVTLDNYPTCSDQHGDQKFENGTVTFTMKAGDTKTLQGFHGDTRFTITENDVTDGYVLKIDGATPSGPNSYKVNLADKDNHSVTVQAVNHYKTGSLTVSKTVENRPAGHPRTFTFTVTLYKTEGGEVCTDINETYGGMTFTAGVATFTLENGGSLTASGLPEGIFYTVEEKEANTLGYTTTVTNDKGEIKDGVEATAAFTNTYKGGELSVTKLAVGGDPAQTFDITVTLKDGEGNDLTSFNGKYGDMTFTDGKATVTLQGGKTATASNLPDGVSYTVEERTYDGYNTTYTGNTGTITQGTRAEATVTNTYKYGELTLAKRVEGGGAAAAGKEFTFTVTGPAPGGSSQTVTLHNGERETLTGLLPGTYTVTETDASIPGYDLVVTGGGEVTVEANKTGEVTVTNTYTPKNGALSVTKTVTGDGGDTDKEWSFRVELGDKTVTGVHGGMTFDKGVAIVKMKSGDTMTATDLPAGVTYQVTELEADQDGYTTSAERASGTIPSDGTAAAAFTNHKPSPDTFVPSVHKTVSGSPPSDETFTFTLTGQTGSEPMPEGNTVTVTGNGTASFGAITYTEEGVYRYTLQEVQGDVPGYAYDGSVWTLTVRVTESAGKLVAAGYYSKDSTGSTTDGASFTNKYDPTVAAFTPQVTKIVTGEPERRETFTFTLEAKTAGAPMPDTTEVTVSTRGTAMGAFGAITFNEAGVFEYTIKETGRSTGGYTYDNSEWTLTVTVKDEGGHLIATGNYAKDGVGREESAVFTNRYATRPTTFEPQVTKSVDGTPPANETFTFTMTANDGAPMPSGSGTTASVTVDGSGTTHFGAITYTEPGTYTYTIRELAGDTEGYTYDRSEWMLTVTVRDVDGKLVASGSYMRLGGGSPVSTGATFTNRYRTGELTISKSVAGGDKDGASQIKDRPFQIGVQLTPAISGTFLVEDATNTYETVTFENGELTTDVFLQNTASLSGPYPHSITIKGLPNGVSYRVYEKNVDANYAPSFDGGGNGEGVITSGAAQSVGITNTYVGGWLKLTKTVEHKGSHSEGYDDGKFKVTVWVEGVTGKHGAYEFDANNKVEIELEPNKPVEIPDLPANARYTVTEDSSVGDRGYHVSYLNGSGTIPSGGTADVTVKNVHEPGVLAITKTVEDAPAGTDISTTEYQFTITLEGHSTSGTETFGDLTFTNGVANFSLHAGETKTIRDLVNGTAYTIQETVPSGYEVSYNGGGASADGKFTDTFNPDSGHTVTVNAVNRYKTGELTVSKSVVNRPAGLPGTFHFTVTLHEGPVSGTVRSDITGVYGGMTFTNGVATFTLENGDSLTATGLPDGVFYTVEETEANTLGYTTTSTGDTGEIKDGETAEAKFTNTYTSGTLNVTKQRVGGDSEQRFTVTVTLTDAKTSAVREDISGTYGSMTFTKGVATLTLKGGDTVTATGLPAGVKYAVAEAAYDDYTAVINPAEGTITKDGEVSVTVTNTYKYGSLTVTKQVTGTAAEAAADKEFTFTVTGPGGYNETFTLKAGEKKTLDRLAPGEYIVTEGDASIPGQKLTVEGGGSVTVATGGTAETTVTNKYESALGGLMITKTVTGAGDRNQEFHFTVKLTPPMGGTVNKYYTYSLTGAGTGTGATGTITFTASGDGTYLSDSVTLKDGQSMTITGLPAETGYEVTEAEANTDGYTTSSDGEKGEIEADSIARAAFTNYKPSVAPPVDPDDEPSPTPSSSPEPSGSPGPSASPRPGTTPTPGPSLPPGTTSEPYNTPAPGQDVPAGPASPVTGDDSRPGLWTLLAALCLIGLGGVCLAANRRRKRNR